MCHSSLDSLRGKEGDDNGYAVYTKVLEKHLPKPTELRIRQISNHRIWNNGVRGAF